MSHTQWERRRAEMEGNPQVMDKRIYNELGDGVKMVKTSAELTPPLLKKMMVATIKEKFTILTEAGHKVPLLHQQLSTKPQCIEYSENLDDQQWAEGVVPMLANECADNWVLEKMCWSAILGLFTGDSVVLWVESVFTNSIWNLMDLIGEKGPRRRLAGVCELFDDAMQHVSEDTHTNYKCLLNLRYYK